MLSTYEPYTKLSPKKRAKYFAMKITYGTKFKVGTSNYKKLRRTWMDFNKFHINLIHILEMKPFSTNSSQHLLSNIWYIYVNHINLTLINSDDQHITFSFQDNNKTLALCGIYASIDYLKRMTL